MSLGLGYSSIVEHLPGRHQALGSIPSTAKSKQKKNSDIDGETDFQGSVSASLILQVN
jgi:hypothetical protein